MSYERYKDFRLVPDDNGCWSVLNSGYEYQGAPYPSKAAAMRAIDDLSKPDDSYIELRTTNDPIKAFNLFIERNVDPSLHAHYADSDDNEAEFVRRSIRIAAKSPSPGIEGTHG
jgi:hypothetical protein